MDEPVVPSSNERAARTAVIGVGILVLAYFLMRPVVQYVGVLLAGGLLALALGSVASGLARRLHIPHGAALAVVLLLGAGVCAGGVAWMGPVFAEQFAQLDEAVPRGAGQARGWLEGSSIGRDALERIDTARAELGEGSGGGLSSLGHGLAMGADAIGEILVLIFFGFFVAAAPHSYVLGALRLLPRSRRERASEVVRAIAHALRLWLLARLALMCFVGTAFGLGLWALGVPLALPLGILAGVLGFIPFLGPTLAFIPAVAVGLLEGPDTALHVTALYLAIQFVEGNVVEPVVEGRTVSLRPGLILVGQVVSVMWFGPIGVLISTPLVVIAVVMVQMLYIQDRLHEPVTVIGQREKKAKPPPAIEPDEAPHVAHVPEPHGK